MTCLVAALVVGLALPGLQAPSVAVTTTPELVSLQPGIEFHVAVRLGIPEGWHIGWKHPGQAGLPTTIGWRTSAPLEVGQVAWPFPERLDTAGTVSNVYRGTIILLTPFRVPGDAGGGTVDLAAELSWGICREICIPQERRVTLSLPIERTPQRAPAWAEIEAAAAGRFPESPSQLMLTATSRLHGSGVRLVIHPPRGASAVPGPVTFFPDNAGDRAPSVTVTARLTGGDIVVDLPQGADRVVGVLVAERGWGGPANPRALAVDVSVR